MPAEPIVWSPVVRAFATWLSGQLGMAVGAKWREGVGIPQVVATRTGGTDAACGIQLDCWQGNDMAAEALAATVSTYVEGLTTTTVEGVRLHGAAVLGVRQLADEAYSRYVCDIVLAASAAS